MSDAVLHPEPSADQGPAGPPTAPNQQILREATNALGSFLRARRASVTPEQAGITDEGVRRVPGLRREEVAMLARISVDYYLRLERGRDRRPSPQVLDAIARALRLDDEHVAHLHALASASPRPASERAQPESVPDSAVQLVHSLAQPAYIEGRSFDVLASNRLARALDPRLVPGGNQLRDLFLDPGERALYREWDTVSACMVSSLRQAMGGRIDDPAFHGLVAELATASVPFRRLWAWHEVAAQRGAPIRIVHPELGDLTLHRERLAISGTEGLMLVVYHAAPESGDAEKLSLLGAALQPV